MHEELCDFTVKKGVRQGPASSLLSRYCWAKWGFFASRKGPTSKEALRLFSNHRKSQLASSLREHSSKSRAKMMQSQYLKALAASLRVGFCDDWKSGFRPLFKFIALAAVESIYYCTALIRGFVAIPEKSTLSA